MKKMEQGNHYGWVGRILHVDLTAGRTWVEEPPEAFYRTYMGGAAMIGFYLTREVPADTDPLGPENRLIFSAGVLTGAPSSGLGRHAIGAKSPLSGGYGKAEVGGYWGAELKFAGWDGIVIEGRSPRPVYLAIADDEVELRDASRIWGKEVLESEQAIKEEMRDQRAHVACIGPAGERQVRYACIIQDCRSVAGRMGLGAVMGAKRLKAVSVRGHSKLPVADPAGLRSVAKSVLGRMPVTSQGMMDWGTGAYPKPYAEMGGIPIRNFRDGVLEGIENNCAARMVELGYRPSMDTCYACGLRCKKVTQVGEPWNVVPEYGGAEYETLAGFGANCGVTSLEAIMLANQICNAQGIDTISGSGTIAFAMECFENGLLTREDTGGIELRFGNAEAMIEVLKLIGERRGIGDLLAEGSRAAAQRIGQGAEAYSIQSKGIEAGYHDPRLKPGLGVVMGINPIGMDHMVGVHDTAYANPGHSLDKAMSFGLPAGIPAQDLGPDKARLISYMFPFTVALDSLLVCQFVPYTTGEVVDLVRAVTGWNSSLAEVHKVGERALALARVFNARAGFAVADDQVPERLFTATRDGRHASGGINREQWNRAREWTYALLGWDASTGKPTPAKLADLGLLWLDD